jgi:hypothetical protein
LAIPKNAAQLQALAGGDPGMGESLNLLSGAKISWELPISKVVGQTLLTLGFGHHSPRVFAEAFFLRFVLDEANEKLAADHEAVVALTQVASRDKVAHEGPGGRRSTHPRVLVPTWMSSGNNRGHAPHHGGRGARSVCLGRLTIENLRNIYSTIYGSSGDGAMLIRGQQTGPRAEFVGFGQVF